MKISNLFSIFIIPIMLSCGGAPPEPSQPLEDGKNRLIEIVPDYKSKTINFKFDGSSNFYKYIEIRLDGCQYIEISGVNGLSHKGNCDNPIHKCPCQQENSN